MNKTSSVSKAFGVRQITTVGILSAVSIVLGLSGFGFIQLPIARATIMHIPVIIGAIIEGPLVGALIGIIFGLFSIIQNIAAPNALSFAFINPLVSVLPRALIGLVAYYCYRWLKPVKSESVRVGISSVAGTFTNTFGVLTMIYVLYAARFAEIRGIDPGSAAKVIYGLALTNGLPEAALAVLVTVPVVFAVRKLKKQ